MTRSKPFPIVVSGPSGAGKTTLVDELISRDSQLRLSVSVTTRSPREGETEGESYFFVTPEKFEAMKRTELVEWAQVHEAMYGTPEAFVRRELAAGSDVVLNIDVQGGLKAKKVFPDAVMIFILPPTFGVLADRIRKRGTDDEEGIRLRLENAKQEIERAHLYDYLVVNDTVGAATAELRAIIAAERSKRERRLAGFLEEFFKSE